SAWAMKAGAATNGISRCRGCWPAPLRCTAARWSGGRLRVRWLGMNPMKLLRSLVELGKGWAYLLAFVSGGNCVCLARPKSPGRSVKISPTAFFKFPEQISIGNDTFINHNCCIWASPGGAIAIGDDVLLGPGVCVIASNHGIYTGEPVRLQEGHDAGIVIG